MFILPVLSDIELAIKKEHQLLKGAQFLDFSSQLSTIAHTEVQEEILFASKRIELFNTLKEAVLALVSNGYPNRPVQIASPEIIQEFKDLLADANLVIEDFKSPVAVTIVSTEK
jgi:hypothetical protein